MGPLLLLYTVRRFSGCFYQAKHLTTIGVFSLKMKVQNCEILPSLTSKDSAICPFEAKMLDFYRFNRKPPNIKPLCPT